MNDKNRNLLTRVASALVALPIVLALLWRGGYPGSAFLGVAAGICALEYYQMTLGRPAWTAYLGAVIAALMPVLVPAFGARAGEVYIFAVGLFLIAVWIDLLFRAPDAEAPTHAAQLVTGLVYASFGLTAVAALRTAAHGFAWVVCLLLITWFNDTLAYFAGRFLGRRKLYPRVSPNKTWEGAVGGVAGSVLGMVLAKLTFFPALRVADVVAVGLVGGVLGPLGDLCESMLKRAYQVKDSGRLLPGHGGMLDRIDALLFNAPVVYLYVRLLGSPSPLD